ncbi:hypothetical protein Ancab_023212 [Ancistrocladus abbreviatus]
MEHETEPLTSAFLSSTLRRLPWLFSSSDNFFQEEDKARLVRETGLQLKQINNWFINQRKRNWQSNPTSSSVLKSSKRKRYSPVMSTLLMNI